MASFIQSVDERTQLAGANKLEALLFSLGRDSESAREEIFGINVFKVREVLHAPEVTQVPDMPETIEGMVCLRSQMIPVINLQKFCGINCVDKPKILMVTEYNKHVQGFLVDSVDTIKRLSWEDVKSPPDVIASRHGSIVTAVSELEDKRLVMIMDVEKVLAQASGVYESEDIFEGIAQLSDQEDIRILFVDDSSVARSQISGTLDHMKLNYISANNGADAWRLLQEMADKTAEEGLPLSSSVSMVLTDVEMPEMDGYVLTKHIKSDPRFQNLPVIMHSSLTNESNAALGLGVGADAYVPKFKPQELASTIEALLSSHKA